jgi:AraC family transcriptional regulator
MRSLGKWLVLSSVHAPWRDSLLVEQHRKPPFEGPEHAPHVHHIGIRLRPPSLLDWWTAGERPRRQLVTPGDVHLTSAGVPMWNRVQEPSEVLVLALAPHCVQHAAHECTGAGRLELRNQRAIRAAPIVHLGLALQAELETGCPGGRLYGEALATALAVHLLQHYAVCPPQLRTYHGGLKARLRRVLEYMQAHLDQELSLAALAALAAVAQMSPYHSWPGPTLLGKWQQSIFNAPGVGLTRGMDLVSLAFNLAWKTAGLSILELTNRVRTSCYSR